MTLSEIIERLEASAESDRELDRDIHWIGKMGYLSNGGDSFIDPHRKTASTFKVGGSPHYTSSMDAALTLVPEGLVVKSTLIADGNLQIQEAWLCLKGHDLDGTEIVCGRDDMILAPPAKAMSLVALLARSALADGESVSRD